MPAVLFVCLGNICRSPMAEGLLRHRLAVRGLHGWTVDSCGTAGHHAGEPADPRTEAVLRQHGASFPHVARRLSADDFVRFDVLLVMDAANEADVRRRAPPGARVHRVLEPVGGGDVPDPWYEGPEAFDRTWMLLGPAIEAWIDRLRGQLEPGA